MIAFTICSRNFLAQAQVLHSSLAAFHEDLVFYVALCDHLQPLDRYAFPFSIIEMTSLGIRDLAQMIERYNITELNTALKPFVFSLLFDKHPDTPVIYLDPDILVLSKFNELEATLAAGADCVLTPHLCEPQEFAEMNEQRILGFGAYNLGFCALRDTEGVRRIVDWWGRRLRTQCVIDLSAGLFVDQKWADLFPSFIERTVILRHPGYNTAYWNLASRTVRFVDGHWTSNGEMLRFFHFSGSVVDEPPAFSRHSAQFRMETLRDVRLLFDQYVELVHHFGRDHYKRIPYAYNWSGGGGSNLHTPESVNQASTGVGEFAISGDVARRDPLPHLPLWRSASQDQHKARVASLADVINQRRTAEQALIPSGDSGPFAVDGFCVICGTTEPLQVSSLYATKRLADGRLIPNWREHLNCPRCGFTSRLRASLHVFFQEFDANPGQAVYVTEQVTPMFDWLTAHLGPVTGSEFLVTEHSPGEIVGGVRHEDLQALSFEDQIFDYVLSFDVLEHVPDHLKALHEIARCLKPGGSLFMTAPFSDARYEHDVRAVQAEDGSIRHLQEPEYHGNPVDENGALCFRYFGWQLLDELRAAGFASAEVWHYWSRDYAYLGETHQIVVATKSPYNAYRPM